MIGIEDETLCITRWNGSGQRRFFFLETNFVFCIFVFSFFVLAFFFTFITATPECKLGMTEVVAHVYDKEDRVV